MEQLAVSSSADQSGGEVPLTNQLSFIFSRTYCAVLHIETQTFYFKRSLTRLHTPTRRLST